MYHQYWTDTAFAGKISVYGTKLIPMKLGTLVKVICVRHSQMLALNAVTKLKTENQKVDCTFLYLVFLKPSSLA